MEGKSPKKSIEYIPGEGIHFLDIGKPYSKKEQLACQYAQENAEARVVFAQEKLKGIIETPKLRNYLINSLPDLQDFPKDVIAEIVLYMVTKGFVVDSKDPYFIDSEFEDPHAEDLNFLGLEIGTTEFHFKDYISELRLEALLLEHTSNEDPVAYLRRDFMETKAIELLKDGHKIPPSLELMLDKDRLAKIKNIIASTNLPDDSGKGKAYYDNLRSQERNTHLQAGSHPAFADKRADNVVKKTQDFFSNVYDADQARPATIIKFFERHPDPRSIIDQILGAKDGKLPI